MKLYELPDTKQWVKKINTDLEAALSTDDNPHLYIPAGETPRPLYAFWKKQKPAYLEKCKLLQIDEILDGQDTFAHFFRDELGPAFDVQKVNDGGSQAHVAILGLGLNGHVGFHEPDIGADFYSGCVQLSQETRGHLNLTDNCWGVTYGLSAFLKCKKILLLIRGERKLKVLTEMMEQNQDLPGKHIADSPNCSVYYCP